jgi:hypothetical protein
MLVVISVLLLIAVLQMVLGMIWYGPLFGKLWMRIMEVEDKTMDEIKQMQKAMLPFYILQFFLSCVVAFATFAFFASLPYASSVTVMSWIVLGLIIPTQISSVIWGSTKQKFWLKQIAVMSGYQIASSGVFILVMYVADKFLA